MLLLGDRSSCLRRGAHWLITESPAPYLATRPELRLWLHAVARRLAADSRLTGCGAVRFVLDGRSQQLYLRGLRKGWNLPGQRATEVLYGVQLLHMELAACQAKVRPLLLLVVLLLAMLLLLRRHHRLSLLLVHKSSTGTR